MTRIIVLTRMLSFLEHQLSNKVHTVLVDELQAFLKLSHLIMLSQPSVIFSATDSIHFYSIIRTQKTMESFHPITSVGHPEEI